MESPRQYITVEDVQGVSCVRLREKRLDEMQVYELGDELIALIREKPGCKIALCLGPEPPECMYSVFLARLVTLRRKILEAGGTLMLCEVGPSALEVFDAARLRDYFTFAKDVPTAVAAFAAMAPVSDGPPPSR